MSDALANDIADDILFGRPVRSVRKNLAQAYDLQDKVVHKLGAVCGRKIAMNAPALMEMAGISEPIVGQVLGLAAHGSGVTLRVSDYAQLALEPEFAAVIGKDVPAGTMLDKSLLLTHVERFSMAFEVLDRRHDTGGMHAPSFVANNVFNAGIVLSDAALNTKSLDAGEYDAKFTAAGEVIISGKGTAPQNPLDACLFVINHFTSRGAVVKAGEVILCGAHHPPMVIGTAGMYGFSLLSGEALSLSISS
ncbi:MAG: hypothetical protein QNK92_10780 [Amylibacter sp.]